MDNGETIESVTTEVHGKGDDQSHDSVVNSCSSLSPTSSTENNFFHSNTDAIDEILADFPENTTAAPRAEMEGDSSDEDPALQGIVPPQAPTCPTVPADGHDESAVVGVEGDEDVVQVDCVQHKVFAVHFNLSATAVEISSTPTGSEAEAERDPLAGAEGEDGVTLAGGSAKLIDSYLLPALDDSGIASELGQSGIEGSSVDEEISNDGVTGTVILSSKIDSSTVAQKSSYDLTASSPSTEDTMYVYEVRRSEKEGSENGSERVKTTRVYIRFSGQNVNGLIEHEETEDEKCDYLSGSEGHGSADDHTAPPTASVKADQMFLPETDEHFQATAMTNGANTVDTNSMPKSASEDSEPPEIPPLPVGGLPPIVRAPGSEEEIEEEKEEKPATCPPIHDIYLLSNSLAESHEEKREDDIKQLRNEYSHSEDISTISDETSISEFPSKGKMINFISTVIGSQETQLLYNDLVNGQHEAQIGSIRSIERDQMMTDTEVEAREPHLDETEVPPMPSDEGDELPPVSFMQTMLKKFRQMEKESVRSQVSPLRTKSAPSTPIRRPLLYEDTEKSKVPTGRDLGPLSRDTSGQAETTITEETAEVVDEFPQKGLAKNLLAQWRMLEAQELRSRERAEMQRRPPVTTRSQSLSRIEETQRMLYEGKSSAMRCHAMGDDGDSYSDSSLITASDDGHLLSSIVGVSAGSVEGTFDDEYLPPPLMTKYVLAKFRDLEAESKIIAGIQPKPRKNFKWEVRESMPLSRGGLIVHGDLPRGKPSDIRHLDRKRSVSEPGGISHSDFCHDEDDEEGEEKERSDELPPPETTKALLAHFRSIEETHNNVAEGPKWPEPRSKVLPSKSEGHQKAECETGNGVESDSSRATSVDRDANPSSSLSVEELPEQGTTKCLLAKFQQMQSSR